MNELDSIDLSQLRVSFSGLGPGGMKRWVGAYLSVEYVFCCPWNSYKAIAIVLLGCFPVMCGPGIQEEIQLVIAL